MNIFTMKLIINTFNINNIGPKFRSFSRFNNYSHYFYYNFINYYIFYYLIFVYLFTRSLANFKYIKFDPNFIRINLINCIILKLKFIQ
jgi:hypothetical protein